MLHILADSLGLEACTNVFQRLSTHQPKAAPGELSASALAQTSAAVWGSALVLQFALILIAWATKAEAQVERTCHGGSPATRLGCTRLITLWAAF